MGLPSQYFKTFSTKKIFFVSTFLEGKTLLLCILGGLMFNLSLSFLTHFQMAVLEILWVSYRALAALLRLESCM